VSTDSADAHRAVGVRNAMSVDVEDYFHVSVFDGLVPRSAWADLESRVVANTERLLEIFDDFDVRATFFVLGWVADRYPPLARQIVERGHEIASHGYAHRLVYDQTLAAFREDVRRAKRVIEDVSGAEVGGYRAPSFSVTPRSLWALEILIEEGYWYDTSIFPVRHDRYGIPPSPRHAFQVRRGAGSLIEMPATTVQVGPLRLPVAGGGYFRILPYAWCRWGIKHLNHTERQPAVFYLHPWEIDPDQPRLPAGRLGRFRHYRNLHKTEPRLRRLLTDFRFGTIASLLRTPTVEGRDPAAATRALPYVW
jgi:polysaccharide deacetylase family protein (PEP-CTERM system associated)